jgi:geranylgeranyl pyrophosphate synthase
MLHTSTLVHDDVIDGALLRRGAPTLNATWTRGSTVLAGDYMFARAAYLAAETGNPRVIRIFSDTLDIIVNGELRQLWARHHFHQGFNDYFQRIEAKTASLFRAAAESAGVLAGLHEKDVQHLRSYGHNLGIAFQIVDDILDFTGDESSLGKPAGSDLLQGTLTLPFFHYVQALPEPELLLDHMEAIYEQEESDPEAWQALAAQVAADVAESPAIGASQAEAVVYLERAKRDVSFFPFSIYRTSLQDLCDFVVQRTY